MRCLESSELILDGPRLDLQVLRGHPRRSIPQDDQNWPSHQLDMRLRAQAPWIARLDLVRKELAWFGQGTRILQDYRWFSQRQLEEPTAHPDAQKAIINNLWSFIWLRVQGNTCYIYFFGDSGRNKALKIIQEICSFFISFSFKHTLNQLILFKPFIRLFRKKLNPPIVIQWIKNS